MTAVCLHCISWTWATCHLSAHSCGLESTLRVLTHSDPDFYDICKPSIDLTDKLKLEEDKLKVVFGPADIERWLQSGQNASSSHKSIFIDSYEVTIYPAESVNNTITLPSLTSTKKISSEMKSTNLYSTWFFDLNGGRTEYIITIACMIGKSRMKARWAQITKKFH